ncbi:MAG: nucleotidyl transferase AbiEii/AbiGii toxin family protein, partial [Chlorobium sp.]
ILNTNEFKGYRPNLELLLFVRDMPRLSVDIDLTYLPLDDRDTAMRGISEALTHIRQKIKPRDPVACGGE